LGEPDGGRGLGKIGEKLRLEVRFVPDLVEDLADRRRFGLDDRPRRARELPLTDSLSLASEGSESVAIHVR
jgi:hypothetical protein